MTRRARATGSMTVELALGILVFLMLAIGTLEVARAMYVFNTVQDVTRAAARLAAVTDFTDPDALNALRRRALLRDTDGALPLVPNLGAAQLRIEYLAQNAAGEPVALGVAPQCAKRNLANCAGDPYGTSCIYYVRASICRDANGACTALPYQPMMAGLVPGLANLRIPIAATTVKAESLGYRRGASNCF